MLCISKSGVFGATYWELEGMLPISTCAILIPMKVEIDVNTNNIYILGNDATNETRVILKTTENLYGMDNFWSSFDLL